MSLRKCTVRGLVVALLVLMVCGSVFAAGKMKTQNVIFIMTDGLRWQEMFHGADAALINKDNGVKDIDAFKKEFWRDDQSARRKAMMPFVWGVVAQKGQIFGNRDLGSACRVENPYWFSYPGYSETLCGYVDTNVNSNDLKYNPNVTVLEWLSRKPEFKGKVAAFGQWRAMSYIINRERAHATCYINANTDPVTQGPISPRQDLLNHLKSEITGAPDLPDAVTFYSALEYLKANKPRVFYLSLGWTDEFAHLGRYDMYLEEANLVDKYIKTVWDTVQSMPQYKGKTTLILATDHGRGEVIWRHHNSSIPGSNQNWMAYMGPDTPALGERKNAPEVTSSHIAATLAAFLGQNYCAAQPKAGRPIADVLGKK